MVTAISLLCTKKATGKLIFLTAAKQDHYVLLIPGTAIPIGSMLPVQLFYLSKLCFPCFQINYISLLWVSTLYTSIQPLQPIYKVAISTFFHPGDK